MLVSVGGGAPATKGGAMPRRNSTTTTTPATPEDAVALRAQARTAVVGGVATAAAHRQEVEGTGVTVALRTLLSPNATPEEKRAHLLACMVEAQVLTPEGEVGTAGRLSDALVKGVLSKGQARTVVGMASGLSYTRLAAVTGVNVGTVKKHLAYAYRALGVNSIPEAIVAAVRCGAVPLSLVLACDGEGDVLVQQGRCDALYATTTPEAVATPAPAERAPLVPCTTEGCTKRTRHASGTCADHRA